MNYAMVHLEMLNILVAIRMWGQKWGGQSVLFHCDNQAVMTVLSTGRTKDLTLAAISRNLFMESAKFEVDLKLIRIHGKANTIADALSRLLSEPQFMNLIESSVPHPIWFEPNPDMLIIN